MEYLYYGTHKLPKVPEVSGYPFYFVMHNAPNNRYDVCFTKYQGINYYEYYSDTDSINAQSDPLCAVYWITQEQLDAGGDWEFRNNTFYWWRGANILFANYDIKVRDTDYTFMYAGTPSVSPQVQLVRSFETSSNGVTSLTLSMPYCTVGNTLVLAFVVRESIDAITLSDGWTLLGGGNNTIGSYKQGIYFAVKYNIQRNESITITQLGTNRIYIVCGEFANVQNCIIRDDMAAKGTCSATIGKKIDTTDVMLYGVGCALYTSGRLQSVTPTDLTKLIGDASAERLACWFDDGTRALQHTFSTYSGTDEATIECVQLFTLPPTEKRYLITDKDNVYYTLKDGAIETVSITTLDAQAFLDFGTTVRPIWEQLKTLQNPTILYWIDDDVDPPILTANIDGVLAEPQTLISKDFLKDDTILGIQSCTVVADDNTNFAFSFDGGTTWKVCIDNVWSVVTDPTAGISAVAVNQISMDAFNEQCTDKWRIRAVMFDETAYITSIKMLYLN